MSNARKRVQETKQSKTLLTTVTKELARQCLKLAFAIASPFLKVITSTLLHRWSTIQLPRATKTRSWAIAQWNWNRRTPGPLSLSLKQILLPLVRKGKRERRADRHLCLARNKLIRRYANNRDQLNGHRYEKVRRKRLKRQQPKYTQWTLYKSKVSLSPWISPWKNSTFANNPQRWKASRVRNSPPRSMRTLNGTRSIEMNHHY